MKSTILCLFVSCLAIAHAAVGEGQEVQRLFSSEECREVCAVRQGHSARENYAVMEDVPIEEVSVVYTVPGPWSEAVSCVNYGSDIVFVGAEGREIRVYHVEAEEGGDLSPDCRVTDIGEIPQEVFKDFVPQLYEPPSGR